MCMVEYDLFGAVPEPEIIPEDKFMSSYGKVFIAKFPEYFKNSSMGHAVILRIIKQAYARAVVNGDIVESDFVRAVEDVMSRNVMMSAMSIEYSLKRVNPGMLKVSGVAPEAVFKPVRL